MHFIRYHQPHSWATEHHKALCHLLREHPDKPETPPKPWSPAIDVCDEKEHITLFVDVPGVEPKTLNIQVENHQLILQGEKTSENQDYSRIERNHGPFYRSFALPDTVDSEQIEAKIAHGVLTIRLPKKTHHISKKIIVQTLS